MIDPTGASQPRDMTGTAAHAALRAFWGVTGPSGRTAQEQQVTGDTLGNLNHAVAARNERHAADYEARARQAWDLHQGGMTRDAAAKAAGISPRNALRRWREMGLVTQVDESKDDNNR